MLQTTDDRALSTQATKNEKSQDITSSTTRTNGVEIGKSIKNLSTIAKLTKSKKSDLAKANFPKVNSSGTDFLTFEAKKTFIHLQKAFI